MGGEATRPAHANWSHLQNGYCEVYDVLFLFIDLLAGEAVLRHQVVQYFTLD